jgi:hypothetical protein
MGVCSPYVDSNIGRITVVTSTTRPTGANLYAGKYIFESDTGRTLMYDGTGWVIQNEPAQSYTPTWTGVTNNAVSGTYRRADGFCEFTATITINVMTGPVTVSLPITALATPVPSQFETVFVDVSATTAGYFYGVQSASTTVVTLYASVVNAAAAGNTYVFSAPLTNAIPFTWAANDTISVSGRYRMTTRYS